MTALQHETHMGAAALSLYILHNNHMIYVTKTRKSATLSCQRAVLVPLSKLWESPQKG